MARWVSAAHVCARTFEMERVCRPALLKGHDIRHRLATAADARDAEGRPLKIGDGLVFGLCADDDCPVHTRLCEPGPVQIANAGRETNLAVCQHSSQRVCTLWIRSLCRQ
jgi:hypothetical protein